MTIAFDLDGVLSRFDTMAALVITRVRRRPLRAIPIGVLLAIGFLVPETHPLRARSLRAVVHIALAGLGESEYEVLVGRVAGKLAAKRGNIAPSILAALREAHGADAAFVTTASEERLAAAYLHQIGVSGAPLRASRLRFTARGARFVEHNTGAAKTGGWGVGDIDTLYTDSASDLPLAYFSRRAIVVAPSSRTIRAFTRSGVEFRVVAWR